MKKQTTRYAILGAMMLFLGVAPALCLAQDRLGGLALYTLRKDMGEDAKTTLQAVADAGYAYIEAAGYKDGSYYGMAPEVFKEVLAERKLVPISTHQGSVTLDNAATQMAHAKAVGFRYFVIPVPPMGMFTFDRAARTMGMKGSLEELAKVLNELGKQAKMAGLQLLYHNHDFEFVANGDGVVPIDYLLEHCDPELVKYQMDLYWVAKAKADPLAYFEKYPGRFPIWHVKDMDKDGKFAPVGKGTIDFGNILDAKEKSGMRYYMVEQDNTFDLAPLEAIKISHQGLKTFGFE
ncbi:sugar phosphate isomerase/epimerase family protein [Maribacter sp. 2307ULW6-5]|uniref:sugar phosphate isomerase/epimerase family protein n=1 Tax=Maribacter sp. 2307ULW6-5 TaxID=3386275 RepID=UPI0039BCD0B6